MDYTVYVLYSKKFDKIYIGFTHNLIQRFHSHNSLSHNSWTRSFRPWFVVYCEYFETKSLAVKREKKLKGASNRNWLREDIIPIYFQPT